MFLIDWLNKFFLPEYPYNEEEWHKKYLEEKERKAKRLSNIISFSDYLPKRPTK